MLLLTSILTGFLKSFWFLIKDIFYVIIIVGGSSFATEAFFKMGLGETSEIQISMARIQVMIVALVLFWGYTWYDQTVKSYRHCLACGVIER